MGRFFLFRGFRLSVPFGFRWRSSSARQTSSCQNRPRSSTNHRGPAWPSISAANLFVQRIENTVVAGLALMPPPR